MLCRIICETLILSIVLLSLLFVFKFRLIKLPDFIYTVLFSPVEEE